MKKMILMAILICSTSFVAAAPSVGSVECSILQGGPANPPLANGKADAVSDAFSTDAWSASISINSNDGYTCKGSSEIYISSSGEISAGISSMELGLPSGEVVTTDTSSLSHKPHSMEMASKSGIRCACISIISNK